MDLQEVGFGVKIELMWLKIRTNSCLFFVKAKNLTYESHFKTWSTDSVLYRYVMICYARHSTRYTHQTNIPSLSVLTPSGIQFAITCYMSKTLSWTRHCRLAGPRQTDCFTAPNCAYGLSLYIITLWICW
jgi:hypothetical protein